jgi:putative membrane protein
MQFIINLLFSAISVVLTSYLLPGVHVENFFTAVLVAALLAVLHAVVKPILVFLTIPITIFTLGLFLLVINAIIILMADAVVPNFSVDGFWWALLFSVLLSLFNAIFQDLTGTRSARR